jgi:hypothetical protein
MPEASTNIYSDSHLHSQQNQIGKMREREEEMKVDLSDAA